MQRLDKTLSHELGITRSEAASSLRRGEVSVNGTVVKNGDVKIDPECDEILFCGRKILCSEFIYIMMNKPAGVLSVSRDNSRPTAIDLIDKKYRKRRLFPAGRLDKDSTGFLLITDDGDLAHRMLSPKSHVEKTYIVTTDALPENAEAAFKNGIILASGELCMSADYSQITTSPPTAKIILKQGKYHQIKRMLGTLNVGVCSLHRISIGNVFLDKKLKPGEYRLMSPDEVLKLTI